MNNPFYSISELLCRVMEVGGDPKSKIEYFSSLQHENTDVSKLSKQDEEYKLSLEDKLSIHTCLSGKYKENISSVFPSKFGKDSGKKKLYHYFDIETLTRQMSGPNVQLLSFAYAITDEAAKELLYLKHFSFLIPKTFVFDPETCKFWSQNLRALCQTYATAKDKTTQILEFQADLEMFADKTKHAGIVNDSGLAFDIMSLSNFKTQTLMEQKILPVSNEFSFRLFPMYHEQKKNGGFISTYTGDSLVVALRKRWINNSLKNIDEHEVNQEDLLKIKLNNSCMKDVQTKKNLLKEWGFVHDHYALNDVMNLVAQTYLDIYFSKPGSDVRDEQTAVHPPSYVSLLLQ